MNILFIGDVVSSAGCNFIKNKLKKIKYDYKIDLVIINAENSCDYNGVSINSANSLFDSGADILTSGNHIFKREEIKQYLQKNNKLIRPLNFDTQIGNGYVSINCNNKTITVINLIGTVFMKKVNNPFKSIDNLLNSIDSDIIIVDFHAETTSEKRAMGFFLDGKVTAVLGTHTHVQTSDCQILKNGTAYITDVGMTGPMNSVLGVDKDIILSRFLHNERKVFQYANEPIQMDCVIIKIDDHTNKSISIKNFSFI